MKSIYALLFEEDVIDNENLIIGTSGEALSETRLSVDSADDQIDSFIMEFESRAVDEDDDADEELEGEEVVITMSESLYNRNLKFLFEQEEIDVEEELEEPAGDEDVAAGPDIETDEPTPADNAEIGDVEALKLPVPKINMDKFTQSVVRLTKNYQSLLDIKTVIINRAKNYLLENYGEKHVEKYIDILNTDFNFDVKRFDIEEVEDDVFSGEAGAIGAGQSGGGGA